MNEREIVTTDIIADHGNLRKVCFALGKAKAKFNKLDPKLIEESKKDAEFEKILDSSFRIINIGTEFEKRDPNAYEICYRLGEIDEYIDKVKVPRTQNQRILERLKLPDSETPLGCVYHLLTNIENALGL
jgi:hypothetical protein